MIVIGWAALMLALLTLWVLSWTENGPASIALLAFLVVFGGIAFWAFGGHRSGAAMTPGEVVMTVYVLAAAGLILTAIAFAVRFVSSASEPALPTSLDCRDGNHSACEVCAGCSCHSAVFA